MQFNLVFRRLDEMTNAWMNTLSVPKYLSFTLPDKQL
jgi:hypothetical protein